MIETKSIIETFPSAENLKEDTSYLKQFLFEEELKSILRLIIWAKDRGFSKIQISSLSKEAKDFLINKNYKIDIDYRSLEHWISWK